MFLKNGPFYCPTPNLCRPRLSLSPDPHTRLCFNNPTFAAIESHSGDQFVSVWPGVELFAVLVVPGVTLGVFYLLGHSLETPQQLRPNRLLKTQPSSLKQLWLTNQITTRGHWIAIKWNWQPPGPDCWESHLFLQWSPDVCSRVSLSRTAAGSPCPNGSALQFASVSSTHSSSTAKTTFRNYPKFQKMSCRLPCEGIRLRNTCSVLCSNCIRLSNVYPSSNKNQSVKRSRVVVSKVFWRINQKMNYFLKNIFFVFLVFVS